MSQKKTNYLNADVELEESTPAVKKKSKKKQNKTLNTVKHVLGVIGTTFLSLFMIVIITCCIVAVTLTVYIMQFADSAFDVDLKNVDLSYTSFIYAKNSAGEQVEVKRLSGDENRISDNPGEAVKQLASDKAASVIRTMKDSADGTIVIGSDTVVVFENVILGKPHDTEDAVNTLKKLQASTHQVYTGVSVWEKKEKVWTEHTFYESTDVTFYPVSDEEIREYVATGEPMDKAGSYGIQGLFGIYVKGINGDYNNVVGLPVARLFYEMKKSGINLRG